MARSLSGVQPSGSLHLGNYFGAIKQHIENQDDAFYFVADYHALTTLKNASKLSQNVLEAAATYLALGLDPARAVFFRQSDIPEVCELMWLLSSVTGMGLLERAVSFKEKKDRGIQTNVGLFTYPVLMAADILLYDADVVPVGSDQVQHVEMTRDIAQSFNAAFATNVFKIPNFKLGTPVPVPGLDGQKMSKSYGNTIPLFLKGKELKQLVMSIKTDATPLQEPKNPDSCNVFLMYRLIAGVEKVSEMRDKYLSGNYGYGHAKLELLDAIETHFNDAATRYQDLLRRPSDVMDILQAGAKRARPVAQAVLDRARKAVGFKLQ